MTLRVLEAILFSPRGGSAHAARALARGLRAQGVDVTLVAGSRGDLADAGDARAFYGEDVRAVDFGPALASDAPLRFEGPPGTAPLHPSFEDRPSAPDAVFAELDDLDYERQVRSWARELELAGAANADVLHLHHLTPLNEAAARVASHVPVVGQLHGTELLMLEQILGRDGEPAAWRYGRRWAERMRGWAAQAERLLVAPGGLERAREVLELPRERFVALPGGVDVEHFRPRHVDRAAFWRERLVTSPRGALPGQALGSARYSDSDVTKLASGTILLYVGRFTQVKRLGFLIEGFARARRRLQEPASLVLVGGHPGEWEGEHPADVAARLGVEDVFLAGWYAHEDLPEFLSAGDAVVIASKREQFGQVLLEGMACGIPCIATRSLGPASIIEDGATGWLVEPDDIDAIAETLVEVVRRPEERARRGRAARAVVCRRFTWTGIAARLAEVLQDVTMRARPRHEVKAQ